MRTDNISSLILPDGLLERFEVKRIEELGTISTRKQSYHIWLDEKNNLPEAYSEYESKGFYEEKQIQDFPIRGKAVYLHVRRRRWRDKQGINPDIKSDYKFESKGVKLTEELAIFLKGGSSNA